MAMIILYSVGRFGITISVLGAVVDSLVAIGLILARVFLRNSIALRPGPLYFSVTTYITATVSFAYSSFFGEAWGPFLLGTFFTLVAVAGTLFGMRTRKA